MLPEPCRKAGIGSQQVIDSGFSLRRLCEGDTIVFPCGGEVA
jgi:hypothetical protein